MANFILKTVSKTVSNINLSRDKVGFVRKLSNGTFKASITANGTSVEVQGWSTAYLAFAAICHYHGDVRWREDNGGDFAGATQGTGVEEEEFDHLNIDMQQRAKARNKVLAQEGIMAGKKIAIYEGYLAKHAKAHPNMVEPQIVGGCTKPAWELPKGSVRYSGTMKIWYQGACHGTYELPDGRFAEVGESNGCFPHTIAAIWPSKEAWQSYDKPMTLMTWYLLRP